MLSANEGACDANVRTPAAIEATMKSATRARRCADRGRTASAIERHYSQRGLLFFKSRLPLLSAIAHRCHDRAHRADQAYRCYIDCMRRSSDRFTQQRATGAP
jgi:hypothetical protein